ncbi:hypothetical protein HHI36_008332 [Cryptolaemus montrouzieri]|uniref:Uncharacterized protein n=1 Tax=Cryptolaemus montrouzieri TaxID=559131 RepID=A0ABD2MSF7_9CUCU
MFTKVFILKDMILTFMIPGTVPEHLDYIIPHVFFQLEPFFLHALLHLYATYADKIHPTGEPFVASGIVEAATETPDIHANRYSNYASRWVGKLSRMENVTIRQEAQQPVQHRMETS